VHLDWNELLAALAIVCIIEGVMPFIHPTAVKHAMAKLATRGERELRLMGFFSILVGLLILFLVRS